MAFKSLRRASFVSSRRRACLVFVSELQLHFLGFRLQRKGLLVPAKFCFQQEYFLIFFDGGGFEFKLRIFEYWLCLPHPRTYHYNLRFSAVILELTTSSAHRPNSCIAESGVRVVKILIARVSSHLLLQTKLASKVATLATWFNSVCRIFVVKLRNCCFVYESPRFFDQSIVFATSWLFARPNIRGPGVVRLFDLSVQ